MFFPTAFYSKASDTFSHQLLEQPFPLASGLAAGWMLWWALAGLIPIALHLWFQRQRQEIPWAAMQFLLAAIQKQSRRIRIQQLLLLLLRVAILLALALAAAQPFLTQASESWGSISRPPMLWIGVIDNSFSMQFKDSSRVSRWEQAIAQARKKMEQLQPGDGIVLMTMGSPAKVLFSEATFDRSSALLELSRLQPTFTSSNLDSTLSALEQAQQRNRQLHPELTNCQIDFFTDVAGPTWTRPPESSTSQLLRKLSSNAKLNLEAINDGSSDNVAVTEVKVRTNSPEKDQDVVIAAQVTNFSTSQSIDLPVQLVIDGQTVQSIDTKIAPREKKQVEFIHRFAESKTYRLEIHIPQDQLAIDDRRSSLLTLSDSLNTLILQDIEGQSKYVALALNKQLNTQPGDTSSVTISTAFVDQWQDLPLDQTNLVVLCNISSIPEPFAALLGDYVRRGGGLLVFLGDRIDPSSYQSLTKIQSPEGALFPLTLSTPSPLGLYPIDPRNYESPILKLFEGFPDSGLLTTPIFRFWNVDAFDKLPSNLTIDISTERETPLLVSNRFGQGKISWWLTAPTPQEASIGESDPWNALGAWPSFLPLMREQASYLTQRNENVADRLVGDSISGFLSPSISDIQLTMLRPDQKTDLITPSAPQQDGYRPWIYSNNDVPGFYQYQTSSMPSADNTLFAVNLEVTESDLSSDGAKRYAEWFRASASATETTSPDTTDVNANTTANYIANTQRIPLFPWCLGSLLGLLVSESLLAYWLGRSKG
ncbi:MAG: hypothetical protein RLY14_576 [Planctomycetota bacterium]|jgi:hypothetical protein